MTEPELPGPFDLHHHGDVEARGARLDFAVNVVPEVPPAFVLKAMRAALETVAAYPDEQPTRLLLAEHLGLDPDSLLLVNGVAEAFTLIAALATWRTPLVVHPQFTEPEAALRAAGHTPHRLVLSPSDGFELTEQAVARLAARGNGSAADLVMIGNPTNPTSRLHHPEVLRRLVAPGGRGRLLVIDEAFMDVVEHPGYSLLAEASSTPGLVVLRSLTKTFGLAGVRAGYVVGSPDLVRRLRALQPPWSVNAIALAATRASATEQGERYVEGVVRAMRDRRPHLVRGLTDRGWRVVPGSSGPFVLASHPQAERLRRALRAEGVAVRRGDTFPGLDSTWVRFALRDTAAIARLLAALDAVRGAVGDVVGGAH